jgi:DNA-binding Xre family transcriptional regulator
VRLVEFNGERFAEDVAAELQPRGKRTRCLRKTGISCGTLNRIVDQGHSVKDITTILSLCAYLGLQIKDYIRI